MPESVKKARQFYGFYVGEMTSWIKQQAEIAALAPSRAHFIDTFNLAVKCMRGLKETIQDRHAGQSVDGEAMVLDGFIPAGGESLTRQKRHSELRHSRKSKRPASAAIAEDVPVADAPVSAVSGRKRKGHTVAEQELEARRIVDAAPVHDLMQLKPARVRKICDLLHIPYTGSDTQDVLAGHINVRLNSVMVAGH